MANASHPGREHQILSFELITMFFILYHSTTSWISLLKEINSFFVPFENILNSNLPCYDLQSLIRIEAMDFIHENDSVTVNV